MPFAHYLQSLSIPDQQMIQHRIGAVQTMDALGARFATSLPIESRLGQARWPVIGSEFLAPGWTAAGTEAACTSHFQTFVQNGPIGPVANLTGSPMAKAATLSHLLDLLVVQGVYPNRTTADAALRTLTRSPLSVVQSSWAGFHLGSYKVMWSTFHATNPGTDPFAVLPQPLTALDVECALGLPDTNPTEPRVLLRYAVPAGITFHIPTVAEGFAGGFHYYFNPRAAGMNDCGYTMGSARKPHLPSMPEVVHVPITGQYLTSPPEIV